MFARVFVCLSLIALISGCGSDTSWYFCSGSEQFCSVDLPDKDDDKPVTIGAVEVARSTPEVIETGLLSDGLEETLSKSPELVAGWLIAGSIGVLADDSDNAATSRFLDNNRYWLTLNEDRVTTDDQTLAVALELLTLVARSRDPAVAGAAGRTAKLVKLAGAPSPEAALDSQADTAADAAVQASELIAAYTPDRCCSVDELMAAAVLLCDSAQLPAADEVTKACALARQWLSSD